LLNFEINKISTESVRTSSFPQIAGENTNEMMIKLVADISVN